MLACLQRCQRQAVLPLTPLTLRPDCVQVLVPHREDVRLEGVDVSQDYLAVQSRSNALQVLGWLCLLACVDVCPPFHSASLMLPWRQPP